MSQNMFKGGQSIAFLQYKNILTPMIVVFSGAACQIATLRLYLKKDYHNLYCVEHGAPAPEPFKQYKIYLEKKLNGKICDIHFRDKSKNSWGRASYKHPLPQK